MYIIHYFINPYYYIKCFYSIYDMVKIKIRSISFDTSFLLSYKPIVDEDIRIIKQDNIPCFLTSTVVSELEQLRVWDRISKQQYKKAIKRIKGSKANVIDFKNRFFSSAFGKVCIRSMQKHHGVKKDDIINDCNILVTNLKNGVDIFLSEDFHFTSKITKDVIKEVKNTACTEFHMMCENSLYSIDALTFFEAYNSGIIDLDIVEKRIKTIKKKDKYLGNKAIDI